MKRYRVEFYKDDDLICHMVCCDLGKAKAEYDRMCHKMQNNKFYTSVELAEVTYDDSGNIVDEIWIDCCNIKSKKEEQYVL